MSCYVFPRSVRGIKGNESGSMITYPMDHIVKVRPSVKDEKVIGIMYPKSAMMEIHLGATELNNDLYGNEVR